MNTIDLSNILDVEIDLEDDFDWWMNHPDYFYLMQQIEEDDSKEYDAINAYIDDLDEPVYRDEYSARKDYLKSIGLDW